MWMDLALIGGFLKVLFQKKTYRTEERVVLYASAYFFRVSLSSLIGRGIMLCMLMPKVERLCNVADVDGGKTPATPRAIKPPLKPSTKR